MKKSGLVTKLQKDVKDSNEKSAMFKMSEKEKEKLKTSLEIKAEEIASLNLSLEAQQKLIAEKESQVIKMQHDLAQSEQLSKKLDNFQNKLVEQDEEIHKFKIQEEKFEHQVEEKDKIIGILRQELDPLQVNRCHFLNTYVN